MSLVNGLGSVSEGDKQMKAAIKLCQPSLLAMRLAADWEAATPLFEKAALNFKVPCPRCTGSRACHHCHGQAGRVTNVALLGCSSPLLVRQPLTCRAQNQGFNGLTCCTERMSGQPSVPTLSYGRHLPRPASSTAAPALTECLRPPQQAKAPEKAIEAYERAAQGQDRLNSPWHAAKHLEQARRCPFAVYFYLERSRLPSMLVHVVLQHPRRYAVTICALWHPYMSSQSSTGLSS